MFKKLFGPYPDEALLYGIDKIIGLYYKIDSKLRRTNDLHNVPNDATLLSADPIEEKVTNVIDEPTTKKDVTSTDDKMNEINLETTTANDVVPSPTIQPTESSSKKCANVDDTNLVSSRSTLKKSSSMQCNYVPSQLNVAENIFHSERKVGSKKVNTLTKSSTKRYKRFNNKSSGFGDSLEVLINDFESRMSIRDANGKQRIETILKKETKQRKVKSPHGLKWNLHGTERGSQTLNELTERKHNMRLLKIGDHVQEPDLQRKVIKTEWAVTRIYTFDDTSQTYEVMKKEMVLDESGSVKKIFAIAPNLTTVAYDPLQHASKKLK